jgi:hypothetical protein
VCGLAIGAWALELAEQSFQTALHTACRQRARLFELRAIDSLRALLERQGRSQEARELVASGGGNM